MNAVPVPPGPPRPRPVAPGWHTALLVGLFLGLAAAGAHVQRHAGATASGATVHPSVLPLYLSLIAAEWGLVLYVTRAGSRAGAPRSGSSSVGGGDRVVTPRRTRALLRLQRWLFAIGITRIALLLSFRFSIEDGRLAQFGFLFADHPAAFAPLVLIGAASWIAYVTIGRTRRWPAPLRSRPCLGRPRSGSDRRRPRPISNGPVFGRPATVISRPRIRCVHAP